MALFTRNTKCKDDLFLFKSQRVDLQHLTLGKQHHDWANFLHTSAVQYQSTILYHSAVPFWVAEYDARIEKAKF